jgi:tetrapyrrole methylase family protein/MazG family protein
MSSITLLGLGPGDASLLTRQAWQLLENISEITLRTRQHPVVEGFPIRLRVHSFDELYENGETFEAVYAGIVRRVLDLGKRPEGVVYGVPGHPYIAEATAPEIARRAREEGIPVRVVEGLSFIEPTLTALELDPMPRTVLVDALELGAAHMPTFPPDMPVLIAQIHSQAVASEVKLTLMEVYPDEHPVKYVHAAGTAKEMVQELRLFEIDRGPQAGLLTTLYVPPLGAAASFEAFQELIAHLRAPDGCPWDREQTHTSLRPYLLEETYEVLAALDAGDVQAMREEFGDLLLQVVLHAQIAHENGDFNMADILQGIHHKIVRRHPHVFGDLELKDVGGVLQNWERLKATEREEKGQEEKSLLESVPIALPALVQALEYQKRAARVGFDWPDIQGVMNKIAEEIEELRTASPETRASEIGDLFFALVNLGRWYQVDAESALRETNLRFRQRFAYIEKTARATDRSVSDLSPAEMDELWEAAKRTITGSR